MFRVSSLHADSKNPPVQKVQARGGDGKKKGSPWASRAKKKTLMPIPRVAFLARASDFGDLGNMGLQGLYGSTCPFPTSTHQAFLETARGGKQSQ